MQEERVVVLNGPTKWTWSLQQGFHETLCTVRILAGIDLALRLGLPLYVCGDSNEGKDLDAMCAMAREAGVQVVRCDNGVKDNTEGDCQAAVEALAEEPEVGVLHLVTCWYHMPRALVTMRDELSRAGMTNPARKQGKRHIRVEYCPVWRRFFYGLTHIFGEFRGIRAVWRGYRDNQTSERGKPDRQKAKKAA